MNNRVCRSSRHNDGCLRPRKERWLLARHFQSSPRGCGEVLHRAHSGQQPTVRWTDVLRS